MKLLEAKKLLTGIENINFIELFSKYNIDSILIDKGKTGKLLERLIGLPPGNTLKDFEDGELKTNKAKENGQPMETMFISQISQRIDELITQISFSESWIYEKIDKLLYLPVVKISSDPRNWYFLPCYYINLDNQPKLYKQLEEDFRNITHQIKTNLVDNKGMLHTTSGQYIQIRTKDAKPYNAIYSNRLNRYVSNKNFAFYFKKEFMLEVQRMNLT